MSIMYQDSSVLNPALRIEDQVAEVLRAHGGWSKRGCRDEVREVLEAVGLGDDRIFAACGSKSLFTRLFC
jgi:ABC-type microcin C transport system duplicated ATPase subunit YejF